MKLHESLSVNELCFIGKTLPQLAEIWRELGTQRISFLSPTLQNASLEDLRALIAAGGYRVETVPHVFMHKPLSFDEASWQQPREQLDRLIGIAAQIGASSIYMLTGSHGGLRWEEAADAFSAAIAPCAVNARAQGVALAIENAPPQYADLHIAHTLRDTVQLAEIAGIGVCADLAGCWTEAGLQTTLERALPRCHVVQVSDYVLGDRTLPNRAVPGDGVMPLRRLLGWLLDGGYDGPFDLELLGPRIDAEGALPAVRRAAQRVGEMLQALGA